MSWVLQGVEDLKRAPRVGLEWPDEKSHAWRVQGRHLWRQISSELENGGAGVKGNWHRPQSGHFHRLANPISPSRRHERVSWCEACSCLHLFTFVLKWVYPSLQAELLLLCSVKGTKWSGYMWKRRFKQFLGRGYRYPTPSALWKRWLSGISYNFLVKIFYNTTNATLCTL